MNIALGTRWQPLLDTLVGDGRYADAQDVVTEGLRLLEDRERKLASLKADIEASIGGGGENSDDDLSRQMEATFKRLRARA
jgi:antitoxin ParD1/3/4